MNSFFLHVLSLLVLISYIGATLGYVGFLVRAGTPNDVSVTLRYKRLTLFVGFFSHLAFIILTEFSPHPPQSYPRTISLVSVSLVALFLLLERPLRVSSLGAFIAPTGLVLFVISAIAFHVGNAQDEVSEVHFMLSLHLFSTVFSYVFLFVAACVSGVMLISESSLKRKKLPKSEHAFPSLLFLDRFYRVLLLFGFTLLVFGLLTGLSATRVLGVQWGEMSKRLVWILPEVTVYFLLLVMVYGFGYRGRRLSLVTLFGVLLVVGSLFAALGRAGGFHAY